MRYDAQPLKRGRTEEGKAVRRLWSDDSGMCRFAHKFAYPGRGGVMSAVTTLVCKDDLIVEYEE